ncbi:hypothetical protein [Sporomusa acidovorans]|uniref:Inner membrane protein YjdF n=1 Tax=Sporomusa acidovorans (strain ATCC 49682 / DSM 3132 / Mol) TaxID=1123286 RepID=A0ABZ3J0V9_SPOA4|nr:hypothetical protein [Sporomusa acidovorans]OZC14446.1 hypothetical protein SPACI_52460 [Sporomusa acidovorans DSM 3132]SDF50181.1 hypothetical protein SAMN04488499_105326 [Sporomusa acidovorans]
MCAQRKIVFALTAVFLLVLLGIVLGLIQQGQYDYAKNIGVKIVLWIIYTFIDVKKGINLNIYIRASVMTVIFSDSFFGLYFDLYTTSSIFDKIQHIVGSYAFSLFAYSVMIRLTRPAIGPGFTFILVLALGLGIGALYEVGEFIGDYITKPRVPSQPSLLDTNLDLIADIIGSLLAAIQATIILVGNIKK